MFDHPTDNSPLHGLVLAGGSSRRMGVDKGLLLWQGKTLRDWTARRLAYVCSDVRLSLRHDQASDPPWPVVYDRYPDTGPLGAIASAFDTAMVDWLIMPVDVPLLRPVSLANLRLAREQHRGAELILFRDPEKAQPEPLSGIWTSLAANAVYRALRDGELSVRDLVADLIVAEVLVGSSRELLNANDPDSWTEAKGFE